MNNSLRLLTIVGIALFIAYASTITEVTIEAAGRTTTAASESNAQFEQDRKAILAMAGNYRVTFNFIETVSFVEDYELKEPSISHGNEVIKVVADEGTFISLQHLLIIGAGTVIKHWRQDWVYEPKEVFEYIGDNSWRRRILSDEEREGKWAQLVYQVDDSPRYAAVAEWKHKHGKSSWTPLETWRPLPRRDATKRDDYDVLACVNRHVITPGGWVHEQDNTKLVMRGGIQALAREVGVNTYKKNEDFQTTPATTYWKATAAFWAAVREEWARIAKENEAYGLTVKGEAAELYNPLLGLAKAVESGETQAEAAIQKARAVIEKYTYQIDK